MGMESALSEMPLALFSTLAPMGAGAFVLLAAALFTTPFESATLKRLDKLTVIPIALVMAGFVCAFFHLANPLHAVGVFANLGSSPMSNEIALGVVFSVVAIAYWAAAMKAHWSDGARKGCIAVVAVIGLVFCLFIGMAYGMETIPSWNIPVVPLSTLFFGLLGGAAVGMATLYAADATDDTRTFRAIARGLTGAGVVGSVLFFGIQMGMVAGMGNAMMAGAELVASVLPLAIGGGVLMAVAAVLVIAEISRKRSAALPWVAVIVVFAGILLARLAFYGVELSIGLGL